MTTDNVRTFLDLSTMHLTPSTRKHLDNEGYATAIGDRVLEKWVASTPYGWFLYADAEPTEVDFTPDLIACMKRARELGCEYILFDQDGPEDDELPIYEDDGSVREES